MSASPGVLFHFHGNLKEGILMFSSHQKKIGTTRIVYKKGLQEKNFCCKSSCDGLQNTVLNHDILCNLDSHL